MSANPTLQIARGLLTCPLCLQESLVRADTLSHAVPAADGAVVRERAYRCVTVGCHGQIKTEEVSRGATAKASVRPDSRFR